MAQKHYQNPADEDELFSEMLKDEFTFFYALTVSVMDMFKSMKEDEKSNGRPGCG